MHNKILERKNAIVLLLVAGAMWSLGGLLIKSIPWHPLAISGMRGGIAAIVIYAFSKDKKIKPTIEIIPVSLSGTTISFVTGFNAKYIVDNKTFYDLSFL